MPHALLRLFSDGREVLGSRVGCLPSWGGLCASFAHWLLPLCSLSRVYFSPVLGRLLFCLLWGTVALFVICWGVICFSLLPFLLSYFLVNISLMFMFRWKAIVGGLGNSCCRWLFFVVVVVVMRFSSSFWGAGGVSQCTPGGFCCSLVGQPRDFFCRVVGPRWSTGLFLGFISWIFYPLSISLVLKLARADFKLSGSELVRILKMTVPFMNPRKIESGWHDARWRYWYVSVGLLWVLMSSILDFVNLFPLYTVVSKKVISCFDSKWVNLRRWWKVLAVWKKFVMSSLVAFSHITKPSSLNRTWVIILFFFVWRVFDQVFQYLVETYVADFWWRNCSHGCPNGLVV